jgi:hypothetical protein
MQQVPEHDGRTTGPQPQPQSQPQPGRFYVLGRASRSDFILLALCCMTTTLALVLLWKGNDSWVYSRIGDLDTWMYVGYGLYWGDPAVMPWNYKASRLPWILYEFLHYHLFRPEIAVPVVQLGCYLWLLIGDYLFTRRLFDPLVSSLTSVALVLWTHIHGNGGADYHNTLSGPLFVWCAYATLRAMQERAAAPWFVVPGGLYLALVVTNPFYLNLSPALVALGLFAWWRRPSDVRYLLSCCLWVIVGIAVAFVMLGSINARFGRNFIFVSQLFAMTKFLLVQGGNTWWKGWGWWILEERSAYLGPIAAMLIISGCELASLLRLARWGAVHRRAVVVHGIYIFHVLLWILLQSAGQTTLDYSYFAYPLWVLWFWSLAAVLAVRIRYADARTYLLVGGVAAITVAALTVAALLYGSSLHALALRQYNYVLFQAGVIVLAFYLTLVGAALVRTGAIVATFVLAYPIVDLLSEDWAERHELTTCDYGADGFHSMINTFRFIKEHVLNPDNALIWVDEGESILDQPGCPRNIRYDTVGNIFANSGFSYLGPAWPLRSIEAIPDDDIRRASDPVHVVAILTSAPGNVDKIRKRFAQQGIPLNLIDHQDFNSHTIAYSVYLLRSAEPTNWTPGIHIIQATYGSNCSGFKAGNATSAVANACTGQRERCDFTVKADQLGNPAPFCAKNFVVKWFCGNQQGKYEGMLQEEADGRSISIVCPKS